MNREEKSINALVTELRSVSKAPLNVCLRALRACDRDVERAVQWIEENVKISRNVGSMCGRARVTDRGLVFGYQGESSISVRSRAFNDLFDKVQNVLLSQEDRNLTLKVEGLEDNFPSSLTPDLDEITSQAERELTEEVKMSFVFQAEGLSFYLHSVENESRGDFFFGGVFHNLDENLGAELHWALKISGKEGRAYSLKGEELMEKLGDAKSIEGSTRVSDLIRESSSFTSVEDLRVMIVD